MNSRRTRTSLICAFIFVIAITLLGVTFDDSVVGYAGYALSPGIWIVYAIFEPNNQDLMPIMMMLLVNILIYWILFRLLLGLSRRSRRRHGDNRASITTGR
jgi:NhaP-type Na+/H+ or K+/H+ antiporter